MTIAFHKLSVALPIPSVLIRLVVNRSDDDEEDDDYDSHGYRNEFTSHTFLVEGDGLVLAHGGVPPSAAWNVTIRRMEKQMPAAV